MTRALRDVEPIYSARGLTKRFGPITACEAIDIDLRPGELTAIVGDNGAGKSTVVKMLTGAMRHDEGRLLLRGEEVRFSDPMDARKQGVEVVYQELALAPNLDVVQNIFLGRELLRRPRLFPLVRQTDDRRMTRLAATELERLGVRLPALRGAPVGRMSGGQRQSVAIARSAYWSSDVLFMDEPTAALGVRESAAVLDLVRAILDRNVAVAMISHVMPHVVDLADHIVVLRQGRKVADIRGEQLTTRELISLIVTGSRDGDPLDLTDDKERQ